MAHSACGVTTACLALALGCGGDDAPAGPTCEVEGGAACYVAPTAPLVAWDGSMSFAPNLSCARPTAVTSTQEVTVSGTMRQYTLETPIPAVVIDAYAELPFTDSIATTTTGAGGEFSMTFPPGTPSMLVLHVTGTGILPTYWLHQRYDVSMATITGLDYRGATQGTLDAIEASIGVKQDAGKLLVAARVYDCAGFPIEHAIITVSSTSKTLEHTDGVGIFYTSFGKFPLPVTREDRIDTNSNGFAALLNVPVTSAQYAQAWGFMDDDAKAQGTAGLTLIGEWEMTGPAGGAIALPIWASSAP